MPKDQTPLRVFVGYSHVDETFLERLFPHLKLLERRRMIKIWCDRMIQPGAEWRSSVRAELERAEIVLLLVSPDFLASDHMWDLELPLAWERMKAGKARVIPVILRPADWQRSQLGSVQALPKDGMPITTWRDEDLAWKNVANGIEHVVRQMRGEIRARTGHVPHLASCAREHSMLC